MQPVTEMGIDLRATPDAGLTYGSAVDGGIRADFNVIFENHDPRLHDFVIASIVFLRIAEAIGSDFGAILKNDVIADDAELANRDVRISFEVVADASAPAYVNERLNRAVLADMDIIFDHDISADRCAFSDFCR